MLKDRKPEVPQASGAVSLLVEDADLSGTAAILVVIRQGQVICKQPVTIGEN